MSAPQASASSSSTPVSARDWRAVAGCSLGTCAAAWSWHHTQSRPALGLLCAAAFLLLLASLAPRFFLPVKRVVDFLIHTLLTALSWLLLGLLFLLCFIPGHLLLRLRGSDPLQAGKPKRASNWNELPRDETPARFRRLF